MKRSTIVPYIVEVGRSRKGAWIETMDTLQQAVPNYGRSREGAWIEIDLRRWKNFGRMVAPVRERGLKSRLKNLKSRNMRSLP